MASSSSRCGLRHGGLGQLATPGGTLIAIGQVTGLLGTYLALIQLLLMSRMPWLDQAFGMDRLAAAHRWIGFATVWLIAAHGFFIVAGYGTSEGSSFLGEAWTILTTFDFVALATVGFGIFVLVGITSMRRPVGRSAMSRGSSSTSWPTSRSPSGSCINCCSAPTSSTTRWPGSTGRPSMS